MEKNKYTYNGKEFVDELDLRFSDYGARWYDASIGRFTTIDPLGDMIPEWSGFQYVKNNPILRIDPDGMMDSIPFMSPVNHTPATQDNLVSPTFPDPNLPGNKDEGRGGINLVDPTKDSEQHGDLAKGKNAETVETPGIAKYMGDAKVGALEYENFEGFYHSNVKSFEEKPQVSGPYGKKTGNTVLSYVAITEDSVSHTIKDPTGTPIDTNSFVREKVKGLSGMLRPSRSRKIPGIVKNIKK